VIAAEVAGLAVALVAGVASRDAPPVATDGPPSADASTHTRVVTDAIEVSTKDCDVLDAGEIGRLLALELDTVVPRMRTGPPLRIELACAPPLLGIAISDPITDKRMGREVPLPADELGRERVVALSIAQLFAASWLELLLPPAPPQTRVTSEPRPPEVAIEAARDTAADALNVPRRTISILVGATIRARALERSPRPWGGAELDVRPWFGRAAPVFRVGFEASRERLPFGTVRMWLVSAGIGGAVRIPLPGRWSFGVVAVASAALGHVRGIASRPDVPDGHTTAATAQLGAGFGPRVRAGAAVFELDLGLGGTLRQPVGEAAGGGLSTPGGLWAGGELRVGVEWRTGRGRRNRGHRRTPG
jgi:hypothetical protein